MAERDERHSVLQEGGVQSDTRRLCQCRSSVLIEDKALDTLAHLELPGRQGPSLERVGWPCWLGWSTGKDFGRRAGRATPVAACWSQSQDEGGPAAPHILYDRAGETPGPHTQLRPEPPGTALLPDQADSWCGIVETQGVRLV